MHACARINVVAQLQTDIRAHLEVVLGSSRGSRGGPGEGLAGPEGLEGLGGTPQLFYSPWAFQPFPCLSLGPP